MYNAQNLGKIAHVDNVCVNIDTNENWDIYDVKTAPNSTYMQSVKTLHGLSIIHKR